MHPLPGIDRCSFLKNVPTTIDATALEFVIQQSVPLCTALQNISFTVHMCVLVGATFFSRGNKWLDVFVKVISELRPCKFREREDAHYVLIRDKSLDPSQSRSLLILDHMVPLRIGVSSTPSRFGDNVVGCA